MDAPATVEFFYDIGSPYSYLAATRIEALVERLGVGLRWRPFLLGAVFKATGNDMPARCPAKARWMLADLQRYAALYGVPFVFPSRFPLNTLKTQRALVAAGQIAGEAQVAGFTRALFHAYWAEDQDVGQEPVIAEVAGLIGLDGAAVVAAAAEAPAKDALRAATDEAVARGAFGAPAFFVEDALFWGNDRLDQLEAYLVATGRTSAR